jgi:hypothetical protein
MLQCIHLVIFNKFLVFAEEKFSPQIELVDWLRRWKNYNPVALGQPYSKHRYKTIKFVGHAVLHMVRIANPSVGCVKL